MAASKVVLTGDKVDTAINIGYACEVMTADMLKLPDLQEQGGKAKLSSTQMGVPLQTA